MASVENRESFQETRLLPLIPKSIALIARRHFLIKAQLTNSRPSDTLYKTMSAVRTTVLEIFEGGPVSVMAVLAGTFMLTFGYSYIDERIFSRVYIYLPIPLMSAAAISTLTVFAGWVAIGTYRARFPLEASVQRKVKIDIDFDYENLLTDISSDLTLQEQLFSVLEKDNVLQHYIDPIFNSLILYPFQHPVDKKYYDLRIYKKLIVGRSRCPYTRELLSVIQPERLIGDYRVQTMLYNRLVFIIGQIKVDIQNEEIITILKTFITDFDQVRNELYDDYRLILQQKKDQGEISQGEFNEEMLKISRHFYGSEST